jgi:arylsulfatase
MQYFEMFGDRAIYDDGWIASTKVVRPPWVTLTPKTSVLDFPWELYDLRNDWTQYEDVAAKYPAKLKEMQELFWKEAQKYQVLPLDSSVVGRIVTPRPSLSAGRNEFTWTQPLTGTPNGDAPSLLNTSYNFKADVEIPPGGADGMLITQGGRFGGYGFYVLKNKPVFLWNLVDLSRVRWEGPELSPGKHVIEFDFKYDGLGPGTMAFGNYSGLGQGGTGVLKVDGNPVATEKMPHTLPFILQWDESLDIGSDTGTPVNDEDYSAPFAFTGKLNKITLVIERPKLSPDDIKRLQAAALAANDGPSTSAGNSTNGDTGPHVSSGVGLGPLQKIELRIDKRQGCRKQADAQGLGFADRVKFVQSCMQQ